MMVGVVMTHEASANTDIHLKSLTFRQRYLERFVVKKTVGGYLNKVTGERFDHESEAIANLFENHRNLVESYYPGLGFYEDPRLKRNQYFQSNDIGTIRVPLKQVDWSCQLSNEVTTDNKLVYLVSGVKADGS
jgi:hypothetical protein